MKRLALTLGAAAAALCILAGTAGAAGPAVFQPVTIAITAIDELHDGFTATGGPFGAGVTGTGLLGDQRLTFNKSKSSSAPACTNHGYQEVFTSSPGNSF